VFAAAVASPSLDLTPIIVAVISSATALAVVVLQQGSRTRRVGRREHNRLMHRVEDLVERFDAHLEQDHGYPTRRKDRSA
jgi:hypothetical protein